MPVSNCQIKKMQNESKEKNILERFSSIDSVTSINMSMPTLFYCPWFSWVAWEDRPNWANVIFHYNINKPLWLSKVKYVFRKAFICITPSNTKCFIKVYIKKMKGDYREEMEQ